MSGVTKGQLRLLAPYLEGDRPTHVHEEDGPKQGQREWNMFCPLHEDRKRSASLNVDTGDWYCFAGCGGGKVTDLIRAQEQWVSPQTAESNGHASPRSRNNGRQERLTEGMVAGWHSYLMSDDVALEDLLVKRGLFTDTIIKHQIGYDRERRVYTIPVRDESGELWNVRRYNMYPPDDKRKIWGVSGHNTPRLYPIQIFDDNPDKIIICEGEWDALITLQNGYTAVTRTGTADTWQGEWTKLFKDKTVYLCHDMDEKGQLANRKLARLMYRIADVRIVKLPYKVVEKHGGDLTDFWMEHERGDFEKLLASATPYKKQEENEPEHIAVLDAFDAARVAKPAKLVVTIRGRKEPGYTVPEDVELNCTRDAGPKCAFCPMNAAGGSAKLKIDRNDPVILELIDAPKNQMLDKLRQAYGAVKCNRLNFDITKHQAVEVLFGRPALDHHDGTSKESRSGEYKGIKITSVGRHDTPPNNTVLVTGALQPNPRSQTNEFQAWETEKLETSVDRFALTHESIAIMKRFQPRFAQRPLKKLGEISTALAEQVTFIHGRPEMHAIMDLTFHSVLGFKFAGEMVARGWLDTLIIGDTRTGKSLAAERLVKHYNAGEIISCEAASFAGVIGGLQQINGRDWAVTWGVVPINDRRLVVLDEIAGLTPEEISQLSDIRSSGVAKLTKIQQEATWARTRLLWLSNPRNAAAGLMSYTYGVDALRPLIGNPEDIARFDLAMAAAGYDVAAEEINRPHEIKDLKYTSEACHTLLLWVWTRQPDQIVWTPGTEDLVFSLANEMGKRYVEDPPLVQVANVRIKIARVAAALAARLFSTDDETHEYVIVRPEHIRDAVAFMDRIYNMQAFGYAERSRERISDRKEAEKNRKKIANYLKTRPALAKYLRSTGKFRRQDLEEVLNTSREEANAIISTLWGARMVYKDLGDIRIEPTLHQLLREGRW